MATALVTGASGFVGRALCMHLLESGWNVRGTVRTPEQAFLLPTGVIPAVTGDLTDPTLWPQAMAGADVVVHLAVHHHVVRGPKTEDIELFRRVNVDGSLSVARQASAAGVRRLVYLSSAKVHGEGLPRDYSESDLPLPESSYGKSKWEAERALRQEAGTCGLELCILRPPLVYGPGVKANFLSLLEMVYRGYPLPLGLVRNRRSLVHVGNLTSAVAKCLVHPAAVGETFLVSDGEDCSTPELVRMIAVAMNRTARLVPVPVCLLRGLGLGSGYAARVDSLCSSFTVDSGKLRRLLDWRPVFSIREGLQETVAWFLHTKQNR